MPTSPSGSRSPAPPPRRWRPPRSTAWPASACSRRSCDVADLAAFGAFSRPELAAVGALLKYVELTQIGKQPVPAPAAPDRAGRPSRHRRADARQPGAAALAVGRAASRACSPPSTARSPAPARASWRRGWRARCATPQAIAARLDAVGFLLGERAAARGCAQPRCGPRPTSRAPCRGSPCSAAARATSPPCATACARRAPARACCATEASGIGLPDALGRIAARLAALRRRPCRRRSHARSSMSRRICAATAASCAAGFRADLDEARALRDDSRKVMAALEARYLEATGIKSLKVRHNNILGYYIEVPAGAAKPLLSEPLAQTFRHRQTMAGAVRFTTRGADRDREPHRHRRRAGAGHRAGGVRRACRGHRRPGAAAGRARRRAGRARLRGGPRRSSRPSRATRGPSLDDSSAFEIRGGRHPGGRAGAEGRQGRRLHRERLRAGDAARRRCRPASTR